MLDLIAYLMVRALNAFFHIVPISFSLWLGRCVGRIIYLFSGKRTRIAYANLKAAFCAEKTPRELKRITAGVYVHMSQTFTEMMCFTRMDDAYIDEHVRIDNMERIKEAASNPRGMILVSAHFGNWELSTVASARQGHPLYMLARDQKMERLNELLNKLRELKGNFVIRKGAEVKKIFQVLREGKSVGILADQNAGPSGELIKLFGRPASAAVGPYRFAQKSGAVILPAFIHRIKGPYHQLCLEPVMRASSREDIIPCMEAYNAALEKHLRRNPEQWFWMHKRWKATPVKKVMVLDDGRKGHLNQSLAVVEQIRRYREGEGFKPEHTEVEVVRVCFRDAFKRTVFGMCSAAFSPGCQGCLKCLRWAVDEVTYDNLVKRYADIVVSCGSALSPVNVLMKFENNARNICVLDPGMARRRKFDLIVVPRHDILSGRTGRRAGSQGRFIITELAPNLVSRESVPDTERPAPGTSGYLPRVGILFGGDNGHFVFRVPFTEALADSVLAACEYLGAECLVTTSRRTPPVCEDILEKKFAGNAKCGLFVKGRDDRDPDTVTKILRSSDVVIVSGESISMVSEAVASGKPVVVFFPERKVPDKKNKYEIFVEGLSRRGYVSRAEIPDLAETVSRAIEMSGSTAPPDDDAKIREKMYRLF